VTRSGYRSLIVFQRAYALAQHVFELTRTFPIEERFALTNQIRRSSRSVAANIVEGYRRARHTKSLLIRFEEANAEASETQVWIDFARDCGYLSKIAAESLQNGYEEVGKMLGQILLDPSRFRPKA
jgi:four helix bundle protein